MMYKILRDKTPGVQSDAFERALNALAKEGWKAVGGITSTTSIKGDVYWAVLMEKEEAKPVKVEPKKADRKKSAYDYSDHNQETL